MNSVAHAGANDPEIRDAPLTSRQTHLSNLTRELFFAVVGPVGAGCTHVTEALKKALEAQGYEAHRIRVSALIRSWAIQRKLEVPPEVTTGEKSLPHQKLMQDRGDDLRNSMEDKAAGCVLAVARIRELRAESQKEPLDVDKPVQPDARPRAFIIDSLKQPAEVELLRALYRNAFALVGVVCDPDVREKRVLEAYFRRPQHDLPDVRKQVRQFIERDSQDPDPDKDYGQQVTDTFHHSDFFINNTLDKAQTLRERGIEDEIQRLIRILRHDSVERPRLEEAAMHAAASAQRASACLSRQVGAALVDSKGNIAAVGTNEAPRSGGGTYANPLGEWEGVAADYRCANHPDWKGCRNTRKQRELIDELLDLYPEIAPTEEDRAKARKRLRRTRIGQLIEFSRAVHAEMDALLSAARSGAAIVGGRLFVTTFPCHYCARHLIAGGLHEIQYIEPYPKSLAIELHEDAIATKFDGWIRPSTMADRTANASKATGLTGGAADAITLEALSRMKGGKTLFRPFVGVAPRLYERAFTKDRDYKDKDSGDQRIGDPSWGSPWALSRIPYAEMEQSIAKALSTV